MGSFSSVLYTRELSGESILFPFSHCDNCHHTLSWYDKIPIISYFFLKGRCRYCDQKIDALFPLMEIFCGLYYLFITGSIHFFYYALTLPFFLALAIADYKQSSFSLKLTLFFLIIQFVFYLADKPHLPVLPLIFLSIYIFQEFKGEHYIGQGDVLIFLGLSFMHIDRFMFYFIFLGLVCGLVYLYIKIKRLTINQLPFCPLIFVAWLMFSVAERFGYII